jgi:hypothetical protein
MAIGLASLGYNNNNRRKTLWLGTRVQDNTYTEEKAAVLWDSSTDSARTLSMPPVTFDLLIDSMFTQTKAHLPVLVLRTQLHQPQVHYLLNVLQPHY